MIRVGTHMQTNQSPPKHREFEGIFWGGEEKKLADMIRKTRK